MRKKSLLAAILLLLATNVVSLCMLEKSNQETALYKNYYKGAEELLDTLENHYNWIDAIDVYSYYDAAEDLYQYHKN